MVFASITVGVFRSRFAVQLEEASRDRDACDRAFRFVDEEAIGSRKPPKCFLPALKRQGFHTLEVYVKQLEIGGVDR